MGIPCNINHCCHLSTANLYYFLPLIFQSSYHAHKCQLQVLNRVMEHSLLSQDSHIVLLITPQNIAHKLPPHSDS